MANVLADLAIESEAATLAALRLARAFDADPADEHEQLVKRLRHPGREVLDLQAGAPARRRGARVPRRRRLRRGVRPAPAVPAVTGQRRVGGVGQRHLPRRAAGPGPLAGSARRLLARARRGRRHRRPLRRRRRPPAQGARRPRRHRAPRPPAGRVHGDRVPGLAAAPALAAGRGRCVRGLAAGRRRRPGVRHPAHRSRPAAIVERARPAAPVPDPPPIRSGRSSVAMHDRRPTRTGLGASSVAVSPWPGWRRPPRRRRSRRDRPGSAPPPGGRRAAGSRRPARRRAAARWGC